MYKSKWFYLGHYRIHHTFTMTTTQWKNIPERVKRQKTNPSHVKGKARLWCLSNAIDSKNEGFRGAVDEGRWHFYCHVVECVGFDREFYGRLKGDGEGGSSSPAVVEGQGGL
jgi:hypothetical protein